MSEYQFIEFRAVDRPLTDAELEFAHEQSSRVCCGGAMTSICTTPTMACDLRRFGCRPDCRFQNLCGHVGIGELTWEQDRDGDAGVLSLSPFHEADELEEIWSPGEHVDSLIEVRQRLVEGDLRALYAVWLCAALDDQSVEPDVAEPPVPAGLSECAASLGPFMEFFGVDPLMLVAAAEAAPDVPHQATHEQRYRDWIDQLGGEQCRQLLSRFLTGDVLAVKAETVASIRQAGALSDWPTVSSGRTFQDLLDRAAELRDEQNARERKKREEAARREAEKKERARQDRMEKMVQDPQKWLRQATRLVDARGTANYKAAAEMLADLREAVGGAEGTKITRKHAAHLAQKHPTLNHLKSSLRKRGLLSRLVSPLLLLGSAPSAACQCSNPSKTPAANGNGEW